MAAKRGNPVEQPQRSVTVAQHVVNPQGNDAFGGGNPAKLRVPQNKSKKIFQSVGSPSQGSARGKADVVTPNKQHR